MIVDRGLGRVARRGAEAEDVHARAQPFPDAREARRRFYARFYDRLTVLALGHSSIMTKLRLRSVCDMHGAQAIDQVIKGILNPWNKRCTAAQKQVSARK